MDAERERFGICASCRWQRLVHNTRGSTFSLCERSRSDERFSRYPPVPVMACPGHERPEGGAGAASGAAT